MKQSKSDSTLPSNGLKRVWIENIYPMLDCGQFPIKRVINDGVTVEADFLSDGIDEASASLLYRHEDEKIWSKVLFESLSCDRKEARFTVKKSGTYFYTIEAWINEFTTWRTLFLKKLKLKMDIKNERKQGLLYLKQYKGERPPFLEDIIHLLKEEPSFSKLEKKLKNKKLEDFLIEHIPPRHLTRFPQELRVSVDRKKAEFSAWYEVFPRSLSQQEGQHGSFADLIDHLPNIKKKGFNVIYLPPIHPIGETNRKGKNNAVTATPGEPGSPWAIGSEQGGHKAIHPELGNEKNFNRLVKAAKKLDIDIALDFALQCSPDHPYLKDHPDWFKQQPDGTLQYAENPPKKYQDIYPFNFDSEDWPAMWEEFKSIILHWIKAGVRIFRVDNPHTKPFIFWQWLIQEIKKEYPDTLFLAEAFTRPPIMYHLAKCGFSQSYTYFTWKNTKQELTTYLKELTSKPITDYFRPNFWPNTPDILHEYLQKGGRPAFIIRLMLAATAGSNYGIYGPAYEQCLAVPVREGSEEYIDSEKYELHYQNQQQDPLTDLITQINKIRNEHVALQSFNSLTLHPIDNPDMICYSKHSPDFKDVILVVINLDVANKQSGFIDISSQDLGLINTHFLVHDLLSEETYEWQEGRCYVELNPEISQCGHVFHVRESD